MNWLVNEILFQLTNMKMMSKNTLILYNILSNFVSGKSDEIKLINMKAFL